MTRRKSKAAQEAPDEPLTVDQFATRLRDTCPRVRRLVDDHLAEGDEILPHGLASDVLRFCLEAFDRGWRDELDRCLQVMADGIRWGDASVENAVAVSFVEDAQWWNPETAAFRATWPQPLREELGRQRDWRPPT